MFSMYFYFVLFFWYVAGHSHMNHKLSAWSGGGGSIFVVTRPPLTPSTRSGLAEGGK